MAYLPPAPNTFRVKTINYKREKCQYFFILDLFKTWKKITKKTCTAVDLWFYLPLDTSVKNNGFCMNPILFILKGRILLWYYNCFEDLYLSSYNTL